MSIPKEPRQLMINLMYLVLTALLALNVSAEILNAFNTVNSGISDSNELLTSKNDMMMGMITKAAAKDGRAETQAILKQAEDAKKLSAEFVAYVEDLKNQVKEAAGGDNPEHPGKLKTEGEMEKTSNLFLNKGKGKELHGKIEDARSKFIGILGKESGIDIPLRITEVPEGEHATNWEEYNFDRVPAVAVMTILTKFQQDAKSAESTILDYLRRKINVDDIQVDKMAAQVVAPSAYVRKGAEYTADIFIGATSAAIKPKVYIGSFTGAVKKDPEDPNGKSFLEVEGKDIPLSGAREIEVVGGMGKIKESASGERKFQGVIQIPHPSRDGEFKFYPFEFGYETFEVGKAVVSPTAMNVLYIGVDNPIKISVPGYASDKVSASGCGIARKSGEEYIAKPTKIGEEDIVVSVKTAKGTETSSEKFRIRRVPDPYVYILNTKGGPMKIGEFKAATAITVKNPDFVFQIPYTVTGFEMLYAPKNGTGVSDVSTSSSFSSTMKQIQQKAKPGDTIVLNDVAVKMPDGRTVKISTSFKLIGG
jgi:gliding motility-associated protein GldM